MNADATRRNREKGNKLMALITKRKFPEAIKLLATNPKEAEHIGSHGDTVLHLACNIYPDLSLVKALLKAHPAATKLQNGFGCAPLHVACRGSSDELVWQLLDADSSVTKLQNKDGNQPIELLCWYRFENNVVNKALKKLEDYTVEPAETEEYEDNPFNRLQHPHSLYSPESASLHAKDLILNDPQLQRIWRCSRYLVQAEMTGNVTKIESDFDDSFPIVHACAQLPNCPMNLTLLAMRLLPNQLALIDQNGCLPLHYLIRNKYIPWQNYLDKVLRSYPGAATYRDPQTKLYPFMMLAVENRSNLQSVYETLRACPELDRMGIVCR